MANKKYGLVVAKSYVYASEQCKEYEVITNHNMKQKVKCDAFDFQKIGFGYTHKDEQRTDIDLIAAQSYSGEYHAIYVVLNHKDFTDKMKYESIDSDRLEDKFATKSVHERINIETYHEWDPKLHQTPEKFGDVDGWLHWFVSKINPKVEVFHIDMNEGTVQPYSVSEEYYKPVIHRDYDQEEADWAIAFGLPRNVTAELLKLIPDESERYAYANGGSLPGSTPDAQVVKCPNPECGRPTWAAPASVGFKSFTGDFITNTDGTKQMTCKHCGADLSPCFSGNDLYGIDYLPTKDDFDNETE